MDLYGSDMANLNLMTFNYNTKVMRKLSTILILAISTLIFSCTTTKNTSENRKKQEKIKNATEMTSEIKTSTFTRFFINDINKEWDNQQKTLDNYIPSKELIDKYGIQLFNDVYFIQGFIIANNHLDSIALNQLNIETGKPMDNKMTIRIPLKSFKQFLKIKGIKYFEIHPKSDLK